MASAGNKLRTFTKLKENDIPIPDYTTDRNVAIGWIHDGNIVVARTVLHGHSGAGIVLSETAETLVNAPLYTKYVKKRKEFRVHVAFGQVIDVQEKRRRGDYEGEPDQYVRSWHKGWVFCREDIIEPTTLRELATRTVNVLGLDFGAVDVIWNEKYNTCYVLEVNTAPGLEGTTVHKYVEAFTGYFKSKKEGETHA